MHASTTTHPSSTLTPPLRPRPDQDERWLAHAEAPVRYSLAAATLLEARAKDGARRDLATSDLRGWAFGSGGTGTMELVQVLGRTDHGPYALRENAYTQLATRLGVPAGYIRDLPARLQAACVNHAMLEVEGPAVLRLAGTEVRAVVSERYAAVDDDVLLELVDDALDSLGLRNAARVRALATGRTTAMRITVPNDGVAVRAGDVIEYGLDLTNSELGLRSVGVTPMTYRLVCSNGLRGWRSEATTRFRHLGDPRRLRELLRDAIPLALADARGDLERWRRSVSTFVDDVADEIDRLRGFGYTTAETHAVQRELVGDATSPMEVVAASLQGRRASAFDVINAATATARGRSVERRLELESGAHALFTRLVG